MPRLNSCGFRGSVLGTAVLIRSHAPRFLLSPHGSGVSPMRPVRKAPPRLYGAGPANDTLLFVSGYDTAGSIHHRRGSDVLGMVYGYEATPLRKRFSWPWGPGSGVSAGERRKWSRVVLVALPWGGKVEWGRGLEAGPRCGARGFLRVRRKGVEDRRSHARSSSPVLGFSKWRC